MTWHAQRVWMRRGGGHGAVLTFAVVLGGPVGGQSTYYVAPCGDDSWSGQEPVCLIADGPLASIQAAIEVARDGDEIIVAPGTYREAIDLLGKAVHLRSQRGPKRTVIDATGLNRSVVTCARGEPPETIVEGFTITGGTGNFDVYLTWGGGMDIVRSHPTVRRCAFIRNRAELGGGLAVYQGNPAISECLFTGNSAVYCGGGMDVVYSGQPSVTGCIFDGNTALYGGGMRHLSYSRSLVIGCRFINNRADRDGGAMHNIVGASPTVVNCLFSGNDAGGEGGAVANDRGAGLYTRASNPSLVNCTFMGNSARQLGGGAICNRHCSPTVVNCLLWANQGGEIVDVGQSWPTVRACNVQGGYPGVGNFDADPLCVDAGNGDFDLSPDSPCIDAGVNWALPQDQLDLDGDGNTRELLPIDLDGRPRFCALEAGAGPGCGIPVVVDVGAVECQLGPVHDILFADFDADGDVDVADLIRIILDWGACADECCLSDLDLDDAVDMEELCAVMQNWG